MEKINVLTIIVITTDFIAISAADNQTPTILSKRLDIESE